MVEGHDLGAETSYATNLGYGSGEDGGCLVKLKEITIEGKGVPTAIEMVYEEPASYGDEALWGQPVRTRYRYPTTRTTNTGDPEAEAGKTMVYLLGSDAVIEQDHPDSRGVPFPNFPAAEGDTAKMRITQGLINDLLAKGVLQWSGDIDLGGVRFYELL